MKTYKKNLFKLPFKINRIIPLSKESKLKDGTAELLLNKGFCGIFYRKEDRMKIFLIAGKARSGKSEVAKIIKHYYDTKEQKTILTEYSKYVKLFAREMTSWDGLAENKPRTFLQEMGDFIRNDMNMPFLFLDRMKEDMKIYENFYDNIVISDVRFPNEIEEMKKSNPKVISFYIINEHGNYDLTQKEAMHPSENALDHYENFDYVVINKDKKGLKEKIETILEKIKEKE